MRDMGRVTACEGNMAQVAIQPHSGCEDCALKTSCSPGESTHTLWALNPKMAEVGDEVVVELKPEVKVFGSALVFLFPLLGIFAGYFIGGKLGGDNIDYRVVGAVLGLVLFFFIVRVIDKLLSKKREMKPVISHVFE